MTRPYTSLYLNSFDLKSDRFLRLSRCSGFPSSLSRTSIIFYYHGLSSSDLGSIRSILTHLGLNITHIPLRFWSNFMKIHSGTLFIHSSLPYCSALSTFYRHLHDHLSSSSSSIDWAGPSLTSTPLLSESLILPWDSISANISDSWFDRDPYTIFFSYMQSNLTYAGNLNLNISLTYIEFNETSDGPTYLNKLNSISYSFDPLFSSFLHRKFLLLL